MPRLTLVSGGSMIKLELPQDHGGDLEGFSPQYPVPEAEHITLHKPQGTQALLWTLHLILHKHWSISEGVWVGFD